jgi:hypothetical protein
MNKTYIALIDYIDTYEEECDVYVHTKDKRIIAVKDVRSEGMLDEAGFYVDHWYMGKRTSVFVPRDDFSHLEYIYKQRDKVSKERLGDDLL